MDIYLESNFITLPFGCSILHNLLYNMDIYLKSNFIRLHFGCSLLHKEYVLFTLYYIDKNSIEKFSNKGKKEYTIFYVKLYFP